MKIKVFEWRKKKGMTGRELSKLTGISTGTINSIENQKTSPTMHNMEKFARTLGVGIEDLYESDYKSVEE